MEDISNFVKVQELGSQKVRKFNDVYLVRHKDTGELGVQKHLEKTDRNEHIARLIRDEAEISFTVDGMPQTLAFAENNLDIVLIRKFQQGVPLQEYWKWVEKEDRIRFLHVILKKLDPVFTCLKNNGIVHCDIKPSNILIDDSNDTLKVNLIDYGMSVRKEKVYDRKTLFALGYSAPELILNKLHILDTPTDIFSLGITFWQLYTGKLPLLHANPGIMTNLQITHPLPEDRSIPEDIMQVLSKMCVKHAFRLPPNHMDPAEVDFYLQNAMSQRYQNLSEIMEDIQECRVSEKNWFRKLLAK